MGKFWKDGSSTWNATKLSLKPGSLCFMSIISISKPLQLISNSRMCNESAYVLILHALLFLLCIIPDVSVSNVLRHGLHFRYCK